jgi:hypothetical protein
MLYNGIERVGLARGDILGVRVWEGGTEAVGRYSVAVGCRVLAARAVSTALGVACGALRATQPTSRIAKSNKRIVIEVFFHVNQQGRPRPQLLESHATRLHRKVYHTASYGLDDAAKSSLLETMQLH